MPQATGRRRRAQSVVAALVLLVVAACAGNGQDNDAVTFGMAQVAALLSSSTDESVPGRTSVVDRGISVTETALAGFEPTLARSSAADPGDADTADPPKARDSGGKVIYLTFDDGPSVRYTKRILDLLAKYDAKATFFQVGENATAHPKLTRSVIARGHALGSHTWDHKDMRKLGPRKLNREITRTSAALRKISGRPITCLRPPYGAVNARVKSAIRGKKLAIELWDIDPRDWKRPGTATIARRVVSKAHPRAVSLMHDGGGNRSQSVRALKRILRSLSDKGYTFESLPGC